VTQTSEQDIQHINLLGTVSLTHSEQLRSLFIIGVVIPHTPNSDHHRRPTVLRFVVAVLRFVVAWFFYVARYIAQRSKILDFPNGPIGPWVMWVGTSPPGTRLLVKCSTLILGPTVRRAFFCLIFLSLTDMVFCLLCLLKLEQIPFLLNDQEADPKYLGSSTLIYVSASHKISGVLQLYCRKCQVGMLQWDKMTLFLPELFL
jgi:hypothetical protein